MRSFKVLEKLKIDNVSDRVEATGGPLCAVCDDTYFQSTTSACIKCTSKTVPLKIGVLSGLLAAFVIFVWSQRKLIQRLRAKYGAAWRDIVRILTINLSYCQVSSSLPIETSLISFIIQS